MARMQWLLLLCCAAGSAVHAQMSWEVVNRFPLLSQAAFASLSQMVGAEPIGMEARLTQVNYRADVKHLDGSSAWDERAARYDAARLLSNEAEVVAKTEMGPTSCRWTLTKNSGEVAFSATSPCEKSPQISIELDESYELRAVRENDSQSTTEVLRAKRHFIVALGDSFTSGEGNPDYPAEFKKKFSKQPPHDWAVDEKYPVARLGVISAQWLGTDCHRSLLSWPALYAIRQAIVQTDTVVQFASFACSGAEVVDGFLLPQRNPPGRIGTKLGGKDWFAKESQQEQLAKLLCVGQPIYSQEIPIDGELKPYLEKYGNIYAKARTWKCDKPVRPNEVLIQFGGNDTSFSGVVKYVFQPQPLKYSGGPLGWFLGSGVNFGIYKALTPVHPALAADYAERLPTLYRMLNAGLVDLGIKASGSPVRLVMYPDPVGSATSELDQAAELLSCNRRTRDANRPMQSLIASGLGSLKHDSAFSGANVNRLVEVRDVYITKLRTLQRSAAEAQGWKITDSQSALSGKGLCAGSLECERLGEGCSNGDRVRWAYWPRDSKYVFAPNTPPWEQMSYFAPYDIERRRGMRYANDALLTSARLTEDGNRVRLDWATGIAHPTASIHARIATLLSGNQAVASKMK